MIAMTRTGSILTLAVVLAGCGNANVTEHRIEVGRKEAASLAAEAATIPDRGPVAHTETPFLGRSVIRADRTRTLPRDLDCADCFVAVSAVPLDLPATIDWLARQTGLAIALTGAPDEAEHAPTTWRPQFQGQLSAFFDAVAARFDLAWSNDGRTIRFDRTVTRMYRLAAGATATTLSATTSGSVSGDSGDTGQTVEARTQVDVWADIDRMVGNLLPPGTRHALSPAAGTLTLTARPSVHARVGPLIDQINGILSPRITARVSLFLIDVSDGNDYGLNIDAIFRDPASGTVIGLEGLAAGVVGAAGALSGAIIAPATGRTAGKWAGSALVARAVARSGRLVDRHHAVISSRGATATPVQLTTRTNYIKELKVTVEDGETTIATVVETLVTGYSLQVLPRVTDGGRLSLYLAVSTADLIDLNTRTFGDQGAFLSLPTVAQRVFTLDNIMADGETLILAGYDQDRLALNETGVGSVGFKGLGGTHETTVSKTRLIIVIEPRLRATPRPGSPTSMLVTHGQPADRP